MFKVIAVTNHNLCRRDYFEQVEQLAKAPVDGILLREKDLPIETYREIAKRALQIGKENKVEVILHSDYEGARMLGQQSIHLPLKKLRAVHEKLNGFTKIGTSVHSVEDAVEAQKLGAAYLVAGHIFSTECKKGAAPRGISFLEHVISSVTIPVYAIGGIQTETIQEVRETGAAGACIMSLLMECRLPEKTVRILRNSTNLTKR